MIKRRMGVLMFIFILLVSSMGVYAIQRIGGIFEEEGLGRAGSAGSIPSDMNLQKLHKERIVNGISVPYRFEVYLNGNIYEIYGDGVVELRSGKQLFSVYTTINLQWLQDKCNQLGGGTIYQKSGNYCLATTSQDQLTCQNDGYSNPQACSGGSTGGSTGGTSGGTTTTCTFPYSSLAQCSSCGFIDRCYNGIKQTVTYSNGVCAYQNGGSCGTEPGQPTPTTKCSDTDSGKTYTTKGIVTDLHFSDPIFTDKCSSDNTLIEYYCDSNDFVTSAPYACSNINSFCSDGLCKPNTITSYVCTGNGYLSGRYTGGYLSSIGKCSGQEGNYQDVCKAGEGKIISDVCVTGTVTLLINGQSCTADNLCKSAYCNPNTKKCEDKQTGTCIEGKYYCNYDGIIYTCDQYGDSKDTSRCSLKGEYQDVCKIKPPQYGNSISDVCTQKEIIIKKKNGESCIKSIECESIYCGTAKVCEPLPPSCSSDKKPADTEWSNPGQACGERTIYSCIDAGWKGEKETKQCDTSDPCSKCSDIFSIGSVGCSQIECEGYGTKGQCYFYITPTINYCSSSPPPDVCCRSLKTGLPIFNKISCNTLNNPNTGETFDKVDKSFCEDRGGAGTEGGTGGTGGTSGGGNGASSAKNIPSITESDISDIKKMTEKQLKQFVLEHQCQLNAECAEFPEAKCIVNEKASTFWQSFWDYGNNNQGYCIKEKSLCDYFGFLGMGENSCIVGIIGSILIVIFIFGILFK